MRFDALLESVEKHQSRRLTVVLARQIDGGDERTLERIARVDGEYVPQACDE
jgi:hypothetical protein